MNPTPLQTIVRSLAFIVGTVLIVSGFLFIGDLCTSRVTRVIDGDTLEVTTYLSTTTVRLNGIDAPELAQSYGLPAKSQLQQFCLGKPVTYLDGKTDFYGRFLSDVIVHENGCQKSACLEMLSSGMAWHYKQYNNNIRYAEAETKAKEKEIGLWSEDDPTPPWTWRKKKVTASIHDIIE